MTTPPRYWRKGNLTNESGIGTAMKIAIMATALLVTMLSAYGQTPKPKPPPTLKETLGWIQDSLKSYGDTEKETDKGTETRVLRLADFSGCRVHFVFTEAVAASKPYYRAEYSFNLGDIDPENGGFISLGITRAGIFRAVTHEALEKIAMKTTIDPSPAMDGSGALFIVEFYTPYGSDFANAFLHAVKMCGGKPSIFTDSDGRDWDEQPPARAGGVAAKPAAREDPQLPAVESQTAVVTARSATPWKDIPSIAKAAYGAIVSIVMSDKGTPIVQGSGFLISRDGIIVTNYHVIKSGDSAVIKLPDDAVFPVDGVLVADKTRDLAVIKTHGKTFQTLTLGNSDQVQVGEEVVAIGNPLSLESTVSNGIVSGIRTVPEEGGKLLQVTAPISHGSSGGPLFNMAGEVIGITSAFFDGGENLNFAIPINDAKRLLLSPQRLADLPNEKNPEEVTTETRSVPPSPPKEAPRSYTPPSETPDSVPTPVDTPITKIAASFPDMAHATAAQLLSDEQYCYHNPSNSLQFSTSVVLSCKDVNTSLDEQERDCKSMGKKAPNGEYCKSFLKAYKLMKEGRIPRN
jgi:S1-C subfamily serine protease